MTVPPGDERRGEWLLDLVRVQDRLRSPGGCPWDAEQTHASLVPYLLEEAYELVEAIETGDRAAIREELGDVLMQITFHARIAEEHPSEAFSIDDVAGDIVDKLVRRHPHVFADARADTAADVESSWAELKAAEKSHRTSVTEGIPLGQPALALAAALQRRAERAAEPAGSIAPAPAASPNPAAVVAAAAGRAAEEPGPEAVGALLFAAVALARSIDVDPEAALRGAARSFRQQLLDAGW